MSEDAFQKQVGGNHYKSSGVQHVEFCQENQIPWCESCAIKYVLRHQRKNGKQDLEKALHYLEFLVAIDYARKEEGELSATMAPEEFPISVERLLEDNEVEPSSHEARAIDNICLHHREGEISIGRAQDHIKALIAEYDLL